MSGFALTGKILIFPMKNILWRAHLMYTENTLEICRNCAANVLKKCGKYAACKDAESMLQIRRKYWVSQKKLSFGIFSIIKTT